MRVKLSALAITGLAACGTTYEVVEITPSMLAATSQRHAAVAAERAPRRGIEEAVAMFDRVRRRVEPVAEAFCIAETEPGALCDFDITLDTARDEVNAYQTYIKGRPTLIFTPAFLAAVGDDDELAYVIGHEAGHHIAGHIDKKQTQQLAGAAAGAVLGALVLVAMASAGVEPDDQTVSDLLSGGIVVGAAAGGVAYSQTFELESDMIGAYITEAAGYDPEAGAAVFPRLASGDHPAPESGQAAFWSTHPSSPERLASASVVAERIRADRAAGLTPKPPRAKALEARVSESLADALSFGVNGRGAGALNFRR